MRMRVFDLIPQDDDSVEFIDHVKTCVDWVARTHQPAEIFLIKVDNWFGDNWLGFSGKAVGQLGVWKSKLTVPPFVPHRIMWERRFVGPAYEQQAIRKIVHVETKGAQPMFRMVADVAPEASLVWFSGSSLRNGRAALMAYLLHDDSYWTWYTGWSEHGGWHIEEAHGITPERFAGFAVQEKTI